MTREPSTRSRSSAARARCSIWNASRLKGCRSACLPASTRRARPAEVRRSEAIVLERRLSDLVNEAYGSPGKGLNGQLYLACNLVAGRQLLAPLHHALQRELHGRLHVFEGLFFGLTLSHHARKTRNRSHVPAIFWIGIDDHHELFHHAFLWLCRFRTLIRDPNISQ